MTYLTYYLSLLLAAFSSQMCPAAFRNVPVSETPNATYTILAEIDTSVQKMNENAAKFVPKVQAMLEKLNTSAVTGAAAIDSALKSSLASFESDVAKLFSNSNGTRTDIGECEDYVTSMKSAVPEVMRNVESCTNGVINEADQRTALTLSNMDMKLDALTQIQKKASQCTANMKGAESDESEVRKIYECAKESKTLIENFAESFSYAVKISTITAVYRGWATQVGCCTSMSEAESFKYATELLYSETETCISKASNG